LRGGGVFMAFFLFFTLASLAVPVPLFPGNMIYTFFTLPSDTYTLLLEALANGITYGLIVWLVFVLATRKLDESGVADHKSSSKRRNQRNNKRHAIKQS
jgi:hypothetical protein